MTGWTGPNAMTVDVEDYFHVAALSTAIRPNEWDGIAPRVEVNTRKLLRMFDDASVRATFFVLGWVADRFPGLVREIVECGHEVACHGYSHQLVYGQTPEVFRAETRRAKDCIEQAAGTAVRGYRAASYSITENSLWALQIIAELGFIYDSSIVPARHDLYGISGAPAAPYSLRLASGASLVEFPPSTIELAGIRLPMAGGGYFRIFPFAFSRWAMRKVNRDGQPFSFYLHPWEVDPGQPRVDVGLRSRFRHYHNLHRFEPRLAALMQEFAFAPMRDVLASCELATVEEGALLRVAGQAT